MDMNGNVLFEEFKQKYNRNYVNKAEELRRKSIFLENLRMIKSMNSKRKSSSDAYFSINKFADISEDEFNQRFVSKKSFPKSENIVINYSLPHPTGPVPTDFTWCGQDYIYSKHYDGGNSLDLCGDINLDQGSCGSCYCVGNAHNLQAIYANMTYLRDGKAKYEMFSPQQMMDCQVRGYYCSGGYSEDAIRSSHYLVFNKDYPYKNEVYNHKKYDCIKGKKTPIKAGYTLFDQAQDIEVLKRIIHHYGPIVSCVKSTSWSFYKGGILNVECEKDVVTNHIISVVGYGKENGKEFLIVRNSWGTDWGINGFVKLSANSLCGIGGNDGGDRAVSLIQHVAFSDKERGPYGVYDEKTVYVEPHLYDPRKDPNVNESYRDESFDSYDNIDDDHVFNGFKRVVVRCLYIVFIVILALAGVVTVILHYSLR